MRLPTSIVLLIALALLSSPGSAPAADLVSIDPDKVLVVMVYDHHCKKSCDDMRPRIEEIRQTYGDTIAVHSIDVSKDVLDQAKDKAKRLGISGFLPAVIDYVPCVGIFTRKRKLVKELPVARKKEVYVKHIEKALNSG